MNDNKQLLSFLVLKQIFNLKGDCGGYLLGHIFVIFKKMKTSKVIIGRHFVVVNLGIFGMFLTPPIALSWEVEPSEYLILSLGSTKKHVCFSFLTIQAPKFKNVQEKIGQLGLLRNLILSLGSTKKKKIPSTHNQQFAKQKLGQLVENWSSYDQKTLNNT